MLKRQTLGFAMAFGSFLVGYTVHAGEKVMYQDIDDNKPEVGISTTVYLGDRMIEQRHGQYKECIVPKFNHIAKKLGGWLLTIRKDEPICKDKVNSDVYLPSYVNGKSSVSETKYAVKLKEEKDGTCNICLIGMGMNVTCAKEKTSADFDIGPYFVYSKNSFQQTIEYSGRTGSVLKFIYSEFSDGIARQPFTREFQVDLNEGMVAAYKGAVIEIENATNTSITYKVLRHFQK